MHKPHLLPSVPNDILDPGGSHVDWSDTKHEGFIPRTGTPARLKTLTGKKNDSKP